MGKIIDRVRRRQAAAARKRAPRWPSEEIQAWWVANKDLLNAAGAELLRRHATVDGERATKRPGISLQTPPKP